jgi:hypothetical protein
VFFPSDPTTAADDAGKTPLIMVIYTAVISQGENYAG